VISLVSLGISYLLAVYIGSRSNGLGSRRYFLLAVIAIVQVVIVMIAMFLMDPPVFKRFGG